MARIRVFVVLVIALTAGGVLAFATYSYVQSVPAKTVSMPTQSVVVAAANLELGAELTRDDLRVIDWPASAVPEGAFSDPKEIIGRGPDARDSARTARGVGAGQRSHRRRRIRHARNARGRRRDRQSNDTAAGHDVESDPD
jgi:Flp pilus assembly protein CpaB